MSRRRITLTGGPPWGFRITGGKDFHCGKGVKDFHCGKAGKDFHCGKGGKDFHCALKISRVNPYGKAADSRIREGLHIVSINGQATRELTNEQAHAALAHGKDKLEIVLKDSTEDRRKEREDVEPATGLGRAKKTEKTRNQLRDQVLGTKCDAVDLQWTSDGKIQNYEPSDEQSDQRLVLRNDKDVQSDQGPVPRNNKVYLHQILSHGFQDKPVLVVKKSDQSPEELGDMHSIYTKIQRGEDIPQQGLRKTVPDKTATENQHVYKEEEVYIHYPAPVLHQPKQFIPHQILQKFEEQNMEQVYKNIQDRKERNAELDYENRKHNYYFLPDEKFELPVDRFDASHISSSFLFKAKAMFNYDGQSHKELSFRRGDIFDVMTAVDKHWFSGCLRGKSGIFPINYVQTMARAKNIQHVTVRFDFKAHNDYELSVVRGEMVSLMKHVDQNWAQVGLGSRIGLVPTSYLWVKEEDNNEDSEDNVEVVDNTDVCLERAMQPSNIVKNNLRKSFYSRDKKMRDVEKYIESMESSLENISL